LISRSGSVTSTYGPLLLTLVVVILGVAVADRTITLVSSAIGFATGTLEFLWEKIVALGLVAAIFSAPVWIRTVTGWLTWAARGFDRVLARAWRAPG
jgi:hypothetical protein